VVFNIHEQNAGAISNVAGNQTWISGEGAQVVIVDDARRQVQHIRQQIRRMSLAPGAAVAAERAIDDVDKALAAHTPDKIIIADRLEKLTQLLQGVGAVAVAGQALTTPLGAIAHWLGAVGQPILRALGG
jgi:hypothetical protein